VRVFRVRLSAGVDVSDDFVSGFVQCFASDFVQVFYCRFFPRVLCQVLFKFLISGFVEV